jgi:hypothetical protein
MTLTTCHPFIVNVGGRDGEGRGGYISFHEKLSDPLTINVNHRFGCEILVTEIFIFKFSNLRDW